MRRHYATLRARVPLQLKEAADEVARAPPLVAVGGSPARWPRRAATPSGAGPPPSVGGVTGRRRIGAPSDGAASGVRSAAAGGRVRAAGGLVRTQKGPGAEAPGPFCQISCPEGRASLDDLDDLARADGAATLADGEAEALFHRDGLDERHV